VWVVVWTVFGVTGEKIAAAIVGPGNIGTDLSARLAQQCDRRPVPGRCGGVRWLRACSWARYRGERGGCGLVVASGSVAGDRVRGDVGGGACGERSAVRGGGIQAVDLTPAHLGPMVCPPVNLREHIDAPNVSMIASGGQATIPMVHAVSRVTPVSYAEIGGVGGVGGVAWGRVRRSSSQSGEAAKGFLSDNVRPWTADAARVCRCRQHGAQRRDPLRPCGPVHVLGSGRRLQGGRLLPRLHGRGSGRASHCVLC